MARMLDLVPAFDVAFERPLSLIDRFFGDWWAPSSNYYADYSWVPASDVAETDKAYMVSLELPGIDMSKTDISYSEGLLTVRGEKGKETAEGESCYCSERYSGSFLRSFRIPGKVNSEKIDATYKDGILKLTLPKAEESLPRKIEVH